MRGAAPTRVAGALTLALTMTLITGCGGGDAGRRRRRRAVGRRAAPGPVRPDHDHVRRLACWTRTSGRSSRSWSKRRGTWTTPSSCSTGAATRIPEEVLPAGTSEQADAIRAYYRIMYGPWDELESDEPFLDVGKKPEGAGFYPEDLTREEFDAWIEEHPEDREAFTSGYTVIRRTEDGGLEAVPYSEAYRAELEPAAEALREAAAAADNPSLKTFLREAGRRAAVGRVLRQRSRVDAPRGQSGRPDARALRGLRGRPVRAEDLVRVVHRAQGSGGQPAARAARGLPAATSSRRCPSPTSTSTSTGRSPRRSRWST